MKAEGFLQITPRFRGNKVVGAAMERVTQTRPREPLPGAVIVHLSITVPDGAFEPYTAEGELPEGARGLVLDITDYSTIEEKQDE